MAAASASRNPPIEPLEPFTPFPAEHVGRSITQRFEEQAQRHGERLAVVTEEKGWTYRELDRQASAIARAILARRGGGVEPIALLFDLGAAVVASIFGVLKAGKFYVILDPSHPRERLRDVLGDLGARLLVADSRHVPLAHEISERSMEVVDFDDPGHESFEPHTAAVAGPDDLASIIYTSGSTGRPKGVMHTHRLVLADVRNVTNAWGLSPRDRWLWQTSISFGGSARTIFAALLNGCAIYPFDSKRRGFTGLADWLRRHEITIFRTVPTAFRGFMTTLEPDVAFPAVRILSMGGEPLFRPDVASFHRHFLPHSVLVHPFGPTESMLVCWSVTPHGTDVAGATVPIGYPVDDKTVLLLGDDGAEVEVGEVGHIVVKSRHLSTGYWQDPDRTQAVFQAYESDGDERRYLTGDLGMRAADGTLRHAGRRDFQVKVRGYRVEVSEIETALRMLDGIRDAVVVGSKTEAGHVRLIAYVVAADTSVPPVATMREHLARTLPDYMIPSVFVAMPALPQTPTGKTDRLRLPAAPGARPEMSIPYAPPVTPLEESLVEIWADLLGIDRVGIHDEFFDLGGDSLMAVRVLARIREELGVEVSLGAFFDGRTIALTAETISALRGRP